MPESCSDIQRMQNSWTDGEYCISVGNTTLKGTTIYCHNTHTSIPATFLSLPAGPNDNSSFTQKEGLPAHAYGLLKFHKIGLNLGTLQVRAWYWTFTDQCKLHAGTLEDPWTLNSYPLNGRTHSCHGDANGRAKLYLTATVD